MKNLYEDLGLDKDATPEEIKKAYRKKAKATHPDSGGSSEEFVRVQTAYLVLSDVTRRKEYDDTGTFNDDPLSKETQIEQMAVGYLMKMFSRLVLGTKDVDFLQYEDIMELICDECEEQIEKFSAGIEECEDYIKRIKSFIPRLKYKGKKNNLLKSLLDKHVTSQETQKEQFKREIEAYGIVMELTEDYEWLVDEMPEESNSFTFPEIASGKIRMNEDSIKMIKDFFYTNSGATS